jgi:peptide/nickel transport system permease protein
MLSRLIHGSRISLSIGFVAVAIYTFIGVILGALAGYYRGRTDMVISRLLEVMICFPTLFLILTIVGFMTESKTEGLPPIYVIMLVIGVTSWPGVTRLTRGEFLRLGNLDFVMAGRALGLSESRIIFRHVLPNALAPVMVSATFGVAAAILVESSLSFLGIGVKPPTATWGAILNNARSEPLRDAWWAMIGPGILIFVTIVAYNLVGEGFRDATDPRLRQ